MRAFRADLAGDLRHRAAPPLILLALLLAAPARAQQDGPIQLVPPPTPAPSTTTIPAPLPQPTNLAPDRDAVVPAGENDIVVAPLQPIDSAWAGTIDENNGGFPHIMWIGTPRGIVSAALPLLQPSTSPVLSGLAWRLLLSDADSPVGDEPPNTPGLLALRIDRLYALGIVSDAPPLFERISTSVPNEMIDRDHIELRFAANDSEGACRDVNEHIARYQGNWWDRALIACQALAGDKAKAALGLSLLADQKTPADPAFAALVARLAGQKVKFTQLPDPTPMRLALLAKAKLPLPPDALASAGPAALYGYATNDAVPPEERLAAAERAALLGALPSEDLDTLYGKISFKPEELAAAQKAVKPPADARGRALLFMLAGGATEPKARVAAMTLLLADARKRHAFMLTARLLAPRLVQLVPADSDPGFAADAARALIAAGHADLASPWIAAAQDNAVLVVSRMTGRGKPQIEPALLKDAIAGLAARDPANAPYRADLLLAALSALGVERPSLDQAPDLRAPARQATLPNAALWQEQQRAADSRRFGETVLTTLLIANSNGELTGEPIVLARAISGLRAVGLDGEAHALAVEAALEAGL